MLLHVERSHDIVEVAGVLSEDIGTLTDELTQLGEVPCKHGRHASGIEPAVGI